MKGFLILFALIPLSMHAQRKVNLMIGDTFPDISITGTFGDQLQIHEFRGSFVMINYWASWNEESRKMQQTFMPIYLKYKDRKFSVARKFHIVSVSIDRNPNLYALALKKDRYPWDYLFCDYLAWSSPAVDSVGVKSIPSNFLIDSRGIIVLKNFDAIQLEKYLRSF